MNDDEKRLTLSREDLYELAWSKPMSALAQDFGISDVALAKRCRRLGIPVPGRGYWARVDAGQTPHRPKLKDREPQGRDQGALSLAPSVGAYPVQKGLTAEDETSESVPVRIAALAITPTASIVDALPVVKRTAVREKHPRRSELSFERGEKTGSVVALEVTPAVSDRALLLADTLLRAAQSLGWDFDDPRRLRKKQVLPDVEEESKPQAAAEQTEASEPHGGRLLVEGEQVGLKIEERFREDPVVPSTAQVAREKREYGYHAPRKVAVATGALRVVRLDTYRTWGTPERRSWYDRKARRVEEQIPEILLGLYELAVSIKQRREKDERQAREREAQERRRQERAAIQEDNQKLIVQLERDAGAWHRARYLRRYLGAVRQRLGDRPLPARFRRGTVNFLEWAEAYVDQLDPLHGAPRTDEFEGAPTYAYQNDVDKMKQSFGRLLGGDWTDAWKVSEDYTPKPRTGYYSGEKSVFEIGKAGSGDDDSDD